MSYDTMRHDEYKCDDCKRNTQNVYLRKGLWLCSTCKDDPRRKKWVDLFANIYE